MTFEFKNLGIIESADIELKGLTIITGLNDTGKSFISKAIFAIIKTVNESNEQAINEKFEIVNNSINQIFSLHRQLIPFTQEKVQQFNPNDVTRKILNNLFSVGSKSALDVFDDYINRVIADIETNVVNPAFNGQKGVNIERIKAIGRLISSSLIDDGGDEEKKFKAFFDKIIIQKLFQGQLNSINNKKVLSIKLREGESELLNVFIKDNKSLEFTRKNIILLNDATIIDSPTIIQLAKFLTSALAFPANLKKLFSQRSDLPYTYYDLLEKMNIPGTITPEFLDIFNEIKTIIGGELQYKIEDQSFIYLKENGAEIKSFNIATGIKSFGLIQLLLNSGTINQNTALIIDEPEVHLHPKWEVEYAKIIVILSKLKIPIIVSTHSPYFLQAVAKYVKEYNTEDLTKVYFGEKTAALNTTTFRDVTNDLEPIFAALSKPMQDIYLN